MSSTRERRPRRPPPEGQRRADPPERSHRPPARRPPAQRRRAPARGPKSGRSDLWARILVAVPAAVVAVAFVDLGGIPFLVLMVACALACLTELYRLLARWRPVSLVGFAAAVAMVLAAHYGSDRTVLEIAMISLPVTFLAVIALGHSARATVAIAGTLLGVWWIGLAWAHAELLRNLPHGNSIIIDVMVGTFLGDAGAYLGGRLFGRRPLAPSISPHKTVEGLFCGMFVAIVAVVVAGLYQPWMTHGDSLLLGVAIAVVAPLGDLFESLVKRESDVKDSGTLFGAHGGALDRLDAIMFTAVAGYYVWIGILH